MSRKDIIKRKKDEVIYEAKIEGQNQEVSKEKIIAIGAVIIFGLFLILILLLS